MIRLNKNPMPPASLATDGVHGAVAQASDLREGEHTHYQRLARLLALYATELALELLDIYARGTDSPEHGIPEAADFLELAAQQLRLADDSPDRTHKEGGDA